jgi:hypothetical protein
MTADQMKAASKMYEEVGRSVFNLSCVIRDPLPEQSEIIEGWLDELKGRIEDVRARVL